ncbi:hypothetical protein [Leptobacterium sp. I13]|uniref:hypothetical protein n=1 Tax=Leptobacterium meishanense TaxID=3128904 RepID=UPI0030EE43CD
MTTVTPYVVTIMDDTRFCITDFADEEEKTENTKLDTEKQEIYFHSQTNHSFTIFSKQAGRTVQHSKRYYSYIKDIVLPPPEII